MTHGRRGIPAGMCRSEAVRRRVVGALVAAALLAGLGLSAGCSGGSKPVPVISAGSFEGPVARVQPGSRTHLASFEMSTGGWSVKLDQVRLGFELDRAFVSLTPPDPTGVVTQALVTQTVDTGVALAKGVEVYARIVPEGAKHGPYLLAGAAPGSPPAGTRGRTGR